jgi:hypothetical protein
MSKIVFPVGLLMPSFLAEVIPFKVYNQLKLELSASEARGRFRFAVLATELDRMIQRARNEQFTLRLARAYQDDIFYAPAFIDFRGRIYRSGVLHFHERDFVRSLVMFADSPLLSKLRSLV